MTPDTSVPSVSASCLARFATTGRMEIVVRSVGCFNSCLKICVVSDAGLNVVAQAGISETAKDFTAGVNEHRRH